MIYSECRVIPVPELSQHEIRGLFSGFIVDADGSEYRIGDAFELTVDDETFWVMCRLDWNGYTFRRMVEDEVVYASEHGHPLGGGVVRKVKVPYTAKNGDIVYIDIETCGLTKKQALEEIERLKKVHPDEEIFLSGDYYAICGRKRTAPRRTRFKGVWA